MKPKTTKKEDLKNSLAEAIVFAKQVINRASETETLTQREQELMFPKVFDLSVKSLVETTQTTPEPTDEGNTNPDTIEEPTPTTQTTPEPTNAPQTQANTDNDEVSEQQTEDGQVKLSLEDRLRAKLTGGF